MRVCVKEHVNKAFGEIPVGSLWADDSPYVKQNPKAFAPVDEDKEEG